MFRHAWILAAGVLAHAVCAPAAMAGRGAEDAPGPAIEKVYFTESAALAEAFAGADSIWAEPWRPREDERTAVQERLGWAVDDSVFVFHRATAQGRDLGWCLVLEEKGRFKPITFLVHVRPDLTVGCVLVMVYREARGDGVRRQRFLKQFTGRGPAEPLRLNREVVGVTGATLSSRALTAGVRKALVLTAARYGEGS